MRKRSIFAAAGLAAATIIGAVAPSSSASAGDIPEGYPVNVNVVVVAPDAGDAIQDLDIEFWELSGSEPTMVADPGCFPLVGSGGVLADQDTTGCRVPELDTTYAIGIAGAPAGATITANCEGRTPNELIPGDGAQFILEQGQFGYCEVSVIQPAVLIDKDVGDGPSVGTPGDFTLEVYDEGGAEVDTGTDASTSFCGPGQPLANCAVIPLAAGSYQLGESGPAGYVPDNVWCNTFVPEIPNLDRRFEAFPTGFGEFTLGDVPGEGAFPFAECRITNRYYEGDLVVTKSVTNDDGGLLGPEDFTAEVWSVTNTSIVASGDCDANGDCIAVTLPIGDYQIGETDPQGYTPTVSCSVTLGPDGPGPITSNPPTTLLQAGEAIPGDDAMVTVEPFGEVTCEIVNDDPTTTTTTTTTLAPTTTDQGGGGAVPTTVAPILPPTGDNNGTMAVIATLLIAIGGALLVARRRTA